MSNQKFIKKIATAAKGYYKKYKILPSLTIAQAILESGWGKSKLAKDCHNYFGMKWIEGCGCKHKTYETLEQRADGSYYKVHAKFRKYSSLKKGIRGYYEFLKYDRYKNLKGVTDYKKAAKLIREDGWATSLSYTSSLISIIEYNKLYKFDNEVLKTEESDSKKQKSTKIEKTKPIKVGDKVIVNGKIYWGGDGSGGHLSLKNREMTVVDVLSKDVYKYYIGVAASETSARMGWANEQILKKIK